MTLFKIDFLDGEAVAPHLLVWLAQDFPKKLIFKKK
jgi:hypothetical protein